MYLFAAAAARLRRAENVREAFSFFSFHKKRNFQSNTYWTEQLFLSPAIVERLGCPDHNGVLLTLLKLCMVDKTMAISADPPAA